MYRANGDLARSFASHIKVVPTSEKDLEMPPPRMGIGLEGLDRALDIAMLGLLGP
jgi:hypothetical protein